MFTFPRSGNAKQIAALRRVTSMRNATRIRKIVRNGNVLMGIECRNTRCPGSLYILYYMSDTSDYKVLEEC